MVATRKSLPSATDDPDPQNPKVRATLQKLRIDGKDALKGDRSAAKPAPPSGRSTYKFRGVTYAVTGQEHPSWLAKEENRKSKDRSLGLDAAERREARPGSARGKKRKREPESVDPQDLRDIPSHKSSSVVATSEPPEAPAVHPLATSISSEPDSPVEPPARRRKLLKVFSPKPDELEEADEPARNTREPEISAEASIAALTEELERAAAEGDIMPRIRDTRVELETSQPDAPTKDEELELDEVSQPAPRRSRRSFRAAQSSTPRTRRSMPKRGSRAQAKDAEPTRDDAVEKDFDLEPMATEADILKVALANLKRDLKRATKLHGDAADRYRSYKRLHSSFNRSTGKKTGQARPGAAHKVNGAHNHSHTRDATIDDTPNDERPSSVEPALNGDNITSGHESSASSPSNSAYHSPMQERTHLHQSEITSAPLKAVSAYKPFDPLASTWNPATSWGKLRLSEEGRAEMALHRPRIMEPWERRTQRAYQELTYVVQQWDEPSNGNGDTRGGAHG